MSRRSVACLISCLFVLAVAELAVRARWTAPWYRQLLAEQAEHQEHEYTTNRFGLRDRDHVTPKPADRLRVLMLGDSFTHGLGVEDDAAIFPELVEVALNELPWPRAPGGVEILNGGLPGSLTKNWVRLFERVADDFDPDLVLIVFFLRDGTATGSSDYFHEVRAEMARLERDSIVYRHSYLYRAWLDVEIRERLVAEYTGEFESAYFGNTEQTKEWRRAQKNLLRLRDTARARGADVALVIFPILVELTERYPFRSEVELLVEFGRENGFPTHDLLPAYLGREGSQLWVSPYDQHPNARGHAVAAEALLPFVQARLEAGH